MRQGQQNRRGRGRGGRKPQNPLARNYEFNGPDVKIRGTAAHIAEKYMSLARDALASGDLVGAESYLQHAEHYNRIIMAAQSQFSGQPNANQGESPNGGGSYRPSRWNSDDEGDEEYGNEGGGDIRAAAGGGEHLAKASMGRTASAMPATASIMAVPDATGPATAAMAGRATATARPMARIRPKRISPTRRLPTL